jgi:uncharacterized protein (TIGR02217 family)
MAITVFDDVILPNSIISAGVRGKNVRRNDRVQTDSGQQSINIGWTSTLRQFEIGIMPLRINQWQDLETLHEITDGGAYGFLMEDPKDCRVSTGGVFALVSPGIYQLTKRYTEPRSGRTKDRKISRPKGTITVFENGSPISASVSPIDGTATIAGSPDVSTLTWTGAFYVPVHFMDDSIDWELVAPGGVDNRFAAGPSVVLQEIRE